MVVRNSEVYHTILQNQDHCLKIELKSVFNLRLQAIVLYKLALIRLIGLIKASLYRTIGKAQLTWAEQRNIRGIYLFGISNDVKRLYGKDGNMSS